MLNAIAFVSKFYLKLSVSNLFSFCSQSKYISLFVSSSFNFVIHSNSSVSVIITKKHWWINLIYAAIRPILVLFLKGKIHIYQDKIRRVAFVFGTGLLAGSSRIWFPIFSLEFFIDLVIWAALWPWVRLSL